MSRAIQEKSELRGDSLLTMLNDTHVVEGLGDETVARTRGVYGTQQQLHRHIERELTGAGSGDRSKVGTGPHKPISTSLPTLGSPARHPWFETLIFIGRGP